VIHSKLITYNCYSINIEGDSMSEIEKLVVLSFDEVYIAHDICFDKAA